MLASQTIAAPLRARAARRVRTSASQRAGVVCSAKPEARSGATASSDTRCIAVLGGCLSIRAVGGPG